MKEGENGLSFRVGVAQDLAEKMLLLANDSLLRERFSKRSREIAARDHDRAPCALGLIGIRVIDHLIVAGEDWYSFASSGDLPKPPKVGS